MFLFSNYLKTILHLFSICKTKVKHNFWKQSSKTREMKFVKIVHCGQEAIQNDIVALLPCNASWSWTLKDLLERVIAQLHCIVRSRTKKSMMKSSKTERFCFNRDTISNLSIVHMNGIISGASYSNVCVELPY